ncbi:MAG: hypothetical protein JWM27_3753 [Gemmatimonadetes bacterium]|nr:hypothetical protein [Gemmatimonadota bacterium]
MAALLALAAGSAVRAHAQGPIALTVSGTTGRPAVAVRGVLRDAALRDALASGLPLRFHLRMELWEKGTFDRLADAAETEAALVRSALEPGFTLETAHTSLPITTLPDAERALERAFVFDMHPTGRGRFYYLATLDVETLSLSDIDELRRWLRGEARPAVQGRAPVGRAVERGLRRFFVRLLGLPTRHYVVKSPFFTPR